MQLTNFLPIFNLESSSKVNNKCAGAMEATHTACTGKDNSFYISSLFMLFLRHQSLKILSI